MYLLVLSTVNVNVKPRAESLFLISQVIVSRERRFQIFQCVTRHLQVTVHQLTFAVKVYKCKYDTLENYWKTANIDHSVTRCLHRFTHFSFRNLLSLFQTSCYCRADLKWNLARQWHDDSTTAVSNVEPNTVVPNSKDKTNNSSPITPSFI